MLFAHFVPGYFAAELSKPYWNPKWSTPRRVLLWGAALGSTALPDTDVVYNAFFNGFINRSTLWTHSIFVYGIFGALWFGMYITHHREFLRLICGLIALGGLSHILLDVVSHGTPFLFPVSNAFVSLAPRRVMIGGFWAYITDPIFLLEPLLIGFTLAYFIWHLHATKPLRLVGVGTVITMWLAISLWFMVSLPLLQAYAFSKIFH